MIAEFPERPKGQYLYLVHRATWSLGGVGAFPPPTQAAVWGPRWPTGARDPAGFSALVPSQTSA